MGGEKQDFKEEDNSITWHSAYADALGGEPWTTASSYQVGMTVDYMLHSSGLQICAVLGGRPGNADLLELLNDGFPSDHLLLFAAFCISDRNDTPKPPGRADEEVKFETMGWHRR